jgi:DnaJ-class molecular chaperone
MPEVENPYDVLGLPRTATFPDVRAAYIRLAKAHHPDKLHSLEVADVASHEEEFKRITMAYKRIEDREKHGSSVDVDPGPGEDWASIFKKIFRQAVSELNKRYHSIEVPVTIEEIHNKKIKKLEVFLKDVSDAIYVKVDCGKWPETTLVHDGHIIKIRFALREHTIYHLDDILGTHDLYTTCNLIWAEYLTGTSGDMLWCDGKTRLPLAIPAFSDPDMPIILKNRGLWEIGDLFIKIHVTPPSELVWRAMSADDKASIVRVLSSLTR